MLEDGLTGCLKGISAVVANDDSIVSTQKETRIGEALLDFGR
jgi:hypothetical protein